MAKLRKMLGDVNSQVCLDIMALIGTQSHATIDKWAVEYAAAKCLPIFEKHCPGEMLLRETIEKCRGYILGIIKLKDLKPFLSEARKYAGTVNGDAAQAAARAVSAACATVQTPTNAFGFLVYAAAAAAYDELGPNKDILEYEAYAAGVMTTALESLKAVAVENEENPVKVNWNC